MERRSRRFDAVRTALAQAGRPVTVDELHAAAARIQPGLGIATVYRHIKELKASGDIHAVELPGRAPAYESAHLDHHHHFICDGCGRIYDLHGCVPRLAALLPPGFRLEGHEITLRGRCAACA